MTMGVSFTVSKKGVRYRPKSKPDTPTVLQDEDAGAPEIHKNQIVISTPKQLVDAAENGKDDSKISDTDISFFINLFPDGYSIGNPSENRIAVQDDPKFLHPYDRTSESLFLAIERGLLPADFLDDIPCKYMNGAVACEVRDYRNCGFESGINGSSADLSRPVTTKIRLKMSLENVVKDIPLISDNSWTYGDLMEAEARILMALHPKLDIDPTPNLDRLCKPPSCTNLNLNVRELRRKRLRQMAGPDNLVSGKKFCIDRVPDNPNSGLMVQPSDLVNLTTQNAVPTSTQLVMMNSYDGQLSPMNGLTKRARSNSIGVDGSQPQQMDGFNSLMPHQQTIQRPYNAGIQKYPFEGSFNPGIRYNLKQEPVDSDLNRNMLTDSEIDPRLQQQQRLLTQQFQKSNFLPTPWNTLDNSRKDEQFQRRKSSQSPRISSGAMPQSPLSSKSGEFSSGSQGGQYGAPAQMGSSQRDKSTVTSVPTIAGVGSLTSNAQMAARRSNSLPKTPAMSCVGSPASVGNIGGPTSLVGKEVDKSTRDKFAKIEMLTLRYQLNMKKNKVDEYLKNTTFPTQQLHHHLFNDVINENSKDETCKMPLSKSLVGGSMNVCKTRVLNFVQTERVLQENGFSLVPKSRTRMILSEKRNDGTVAMHYGELDDCDYLASEECLPTLSNTHVADLLAAQFCTLISREGYLVDGDHLQPKPIHTVRSSSDQQTNNASGVLSPNIETQETVSNSEIAKTSDNGSNNNNSSGVRMHPPANSQPLQGGGGGLLPPTRPLQPDSQPLFQQNQHNLIQQQVQRSSATMLATNSLSHLGQNSNMQQLGHMLNKTSPIPLQMLQQQPPQIQRKLMMGIGNVGIGGNIGNNNMVGIQGRGNNMIGGNNGNNMVGIQGNNMIGGNRGISPTMSGVISGMGNNMSQNAIGMNQATSISNVISQQLRSGMITPAQAHLINTKLRIVQQSRNMLGGTGGQSGNLTGLPGGNNYSMLVSNMNRVNNMNPLKRTVMAPPKLISGYMNQQQQMPHQQQQPQQMPHQQDSTSPLQAVLSPPQQVGSPSMGLPHPQQASPQQMSQRTPISPQLSSGAIHAQMSASNQEANGPASPQLSSQTMGSVSSMTNSPIDMQGVNKSN